MNHRAASVRDGALGAKSENDTRHAGGQGFVERMHFAATLAQGGYDPLAGEDAAAGGSNAQFNCLVPGNG